jgi:hypothetical protein
MVDIAGPRGDGSFAVAAAGRLFVWSRAGGLKPFAQGRGLSPRPGRSRISPSRASRRGCTRALSLHAAAPGNAGGVRVPGQAFGALTILPEEAFESAHGESDGLCGYLCRCYKWFLCRGHRKQPARSAG